jgi:hypothetical protein
MLGEKWDLRSRTAIVAALVVVGVFFGYVYVNASGMRGPEVRVLL